MTVSAVIPIRFCDCCDERGAPHFTLSGQALWDITISQALETSRLAETIVAYDDERFERKLEKWKGRVRFCQRPPRLSEADATVLDVLAYVAETSREQGFGADFLMLMEITHPLRPKGIVDQMVSALDALEVDSLITCRRSHYSLWRKNPSGSVDRIRGAGEREGTEIFQELIGICSVFRSSFLSSETPFGEQVDIVPIDKYWATIDVRDENGLWLAEQYLERTGVVL